MKEWDGKERRKSELSDEQKREILEYLQQLFERQVGRGTLSALRKLCWALCLAGFGYLTAHAKAIAEWAFK